MNARTILLIAAALWASLSTPAEAQRSNRAMPARDCNKTLLALNPAVTCMVPHYVNQSQVSTQDSFISGTVVNTSVYMVLSMSYTGAPLRPYPEQQSVGVLKNLNDNTRKQGRDWSAIKSDGNTSYLTFKTDNENCIGFDHAGPLKDAGYAWTLRGYLCAPTGGTAPDFELTKKYLAATRVGPLRDNLNAFGQPVRGLQWQN